MVLAIELNGFFTRIDLEPFDLLLPVVRFFYGAVEYMTHGWCDIHADAITFDKWDDGVIGHFQRAVGFFLNFCSGIRWCNFIVAHVLNANNFGCSFGLEV